MVRNLSWKADACSKEALRKSGVVGVLVRAAMSSSKESTLKSTLSAVWNLSSHCTENKAEICAIPNALAFLVSTLTYKGAAPNLTVIENGGGVLRNVSSQVALKEPLRATLRSTGCYRVLLRHLQSPSLTVVSNACGTLWNLSARCPEDQRLLWELGAVPMLKNLMNSKHRMISLASTAALKNLYSLQEQQKATGGDGSTAVDAAGNSLNNSRTGSLMSQRRQRAFEQQLDRHLSNVYRMMSPPAIDNALMPTVSSYSVGNSLERSSTRRVPQKELMQLVQDVVSPVSPQRSFRSKSISGRAQASSAPPAEYSAQRKSSLHKPVVSKEEKMLQVGLFF